MRHKLVDHVRVRDNGREAQLRSDVCGTRRGREDVVIVDEWVPLGLASQGLEQANQCIAESTEALYDRRDELAAYALRKRVVIAERSEKDGETAIPKRSPILSFPVSATW